MDTHTSISRRDALKLGAAAAGAGLALATPVGRATAAHVNASTDLTAWTWGGTATLQATYKTLASVYPSIKNINFHAISPGQGDLDVAKAFRLALAAHKNVPDAIQLNYTEVPEFAQAGVLRDLGDVFAPVKNDLYAGALQIAQYDGKFVAFPFEVKSKLYYYRADLFDKAGISPADMATLAGFIHAGQKLHAKFPKSYLINVGPQPAQYWMGEILSAYPSTRMADSSGNYQVASSKAFSDMFTFFQRVKNAKIAWPVDDFSTDWAQGFKNGIIASDLLASWMKFFLPGYATAAQAGKWQATTWPALAPMANQEFGAEAGGSVWVIPAGAKNPEAAITFLRAWHLEQKGAMAMLENGGTTPLLKSMKADVLSFVNGGKKPASMDQKTWLIQPKNFFAKTNGKSYAEIELDSYDWVRVFPYDPQASKEVTILQQALFTVMAGKASVQQALTQAQSDMQSQIGNPYQS